MSVYLALLAAAATLSVIITPLATAAARALGLVDAPGGRKVHPRAVPRIGGLAVVLAASLAVWAWTDRNLPGLSSTEVGTMWPLLAGAGLVFAIGFIDDVRPLPVWPRLLVQLMAAVVVMASGSLIERITVGGFTWELGLAAWLVTPVWIVGLTNAFNLIDGLDGLATGIGVIAGTACAVILVNRGHFVEAALLIAMVGAGLGFLTFNFAPASVFLGDGGSLVIGFMLAATAITGWQKGATALAAGVPLLIFALPLADATTALARRVAARPGSGPLSVTMILRQIVEPDRLHIHHRLTALGWSTRQAVLILYAVTIALSALALMTASTATGQPVIR